MALIVGFAVAVVGAPVAGQIARRLGWVDRPGSLKVQTEPVPYLGGLAVFAGLVGPLAVARPVLIVPLALSLALGVADDVRGPSPAVRLSAEVAIGVVTAFALPAGDLPGALFTVAAVIALLNAVNLLDGLDGLAGGVCLISALGFALVLDDEFQVLALGLAGGLIGFLVWNRPPARIYLGDGGSYMVGNALAILLAASFTNGDSLAFATGTLLFLAVPAADMVITIVRRLRAGRPLLYGDRGHVYDQLLDRGWDPLMTVGVCMLVQGVLVGAGVAIGNLPAGVAVAITAPLVVIVGAVSLLAFTTPGTWKAR